MKTRGGRVVLDTGILLAAVLPHDADHGAAAHLLDRLARREWSSAHTTDYVLTEALNFVRMKVKRRETAEALLGLVFGSEEMPPFVASVHRVHGGRFARAAERYRTEFDRGLSLTDWTTVATAEELGDAAVATFDSGLRGIVEVVDL